MPQANWNQVTNLLCIRPDNLGDVIMTSPAIRALKQAVPGRKVTLLTSPMGSAVASLIPDVDEVIETAVPWVETTDNPTADSVLNFAQQLRDKHFDGAVIFTVFSQSALPSAVLAYIAGIPQRAAMTREDPHQLLTTWIPDREPFVPLKHEVERQLDFVRQLGVVVTDEKYALKIPSDDRVVADRMLQESGVSASEKFLVLHVGVSSSFRQYPPQLFAQAGKLLLEKTGMSIVLTGSQSEHELVESVQAEIGEGSVSLAGKLSLPQLAAVVEKASVLISNNTGPVHVAAAVETPVVVMSSLTNHQHTPWGVEHEVIYFDIPEKDVLHQNPLLKYLYDQYLLDKVPETLPAPQQIVEAVHRVLMQPHV